MRSLTVPSISLESAGLRMKSYLNSWDVGKSDCEYGFCRSSILTQINTPVSRDGSSAVIVNAMSNPGSWTTLSFLLQWPKVSAATKGHKVRRGNIKAAPARRGGIDD